MLYAPNAVKLKIQSGKNYIDVPPHVASHPLWRAILEVLRLQSDLYVTNLCAFAWFHVSLMIWLTLNHCDV
jgi:hypothetical protein